MKTPDWQLAVLPSAPQYCGATPTEAWPFLANSLASMLQTPCASDKLWAESSQCRCCSQDSSHRYSLTKRWRLRTLCGPSNSRAIASTFLRSVLLNNPCRYSSHNSLGSVRRNVSPNNCVNSLSSRPTHSISSMLSLNSGGSLGSHDSLACFIRVLLG